MCLHFSKIFASLLCALCLLVSFSTQAPAILTSLNTAPTFHVADGKLTTDFASENDFAFSVNVQNDGKVIVAGYSVISGTNEFAVARYNSDGSLDTSFSDDGKVTNGFPPNSSAQGFCATLQTDGKILVAGSSGGFAIARYNTDGSLDTSFSGGGRVTTDFSGWWSSFGKSITLQDDGKILVAGYVSNSSGLDFALARYNIDGSLDTSFSGDGKVTTDLGPEDVANSITVQEDGKIVVAGYTGENNSGRDFLLVRYNTDGSLDTSFSGDGKVTTDFGSNQDYANSVTIQADGKILVAGHVEVSGSYSALARYNTDGSLDTSLSDDGKITLGPSIASSLTTQDDGKILMAGYYTVARLNADGSFDTSFSDDGKVSGVYGTSIAVQGDGKILATGYTNGDFSLIRLNTDGSFDSTFSPPENTLIATPSYIENRSPIVLDTNVYILDIELSAIGNYSGASLSLSRHGGANVTDAFSAGAGLTVLTEGAYIATDNVTIGRVITNSNGSLVLVFNVNATQNLVSKAMQQIAYQNTSEAPPESVQIDWTFNDENDGSQGGGGALSVTGSTNVNITARNDNPVLIKSLVNQSVFANSTFNFSISDDAFFDPDGDTLSYSIAMADGTAVPPWLKYDENTRSLSGLPSQSDLGSFEIRVSAIDGVGASASGVFLLTVIADADTDGDGLMDSVDPQPAIYNSPLDNDTAFVRQVYLDFLNREPDAEGLNHWVGQLDAGVFDRSELVEQYLDSAEFGETVSPVVRLYFTYYQRIPDYEGLMFWVNSYAAGMSLNNISDAFATAQEFIDKYGALTNEEFVSQMYINVYGRQPDAEGLAFWADFLNAATLTRGQVMVEFSSALEYLSISANQVYVTMTYMGLLRRAPDQEGFDYWAGIMDGGASGLALIDSFLISDEYAKRFMSLNVSIDGVGGVAFIGEEINLNTTVNSNPNEASLTYSWRWFGPTGTAALMSGYLTSAPFITPDVPGEYTFEVTVCDVNNCIIDDVSYTVRSPVDVSFGVSSSMRTDSLCYFNGDIGIDSATWFFSDCNIYGYPGNKLYMSVRNNTLNDVTVTGYSIDYPTGFDVFGGIAAEAQVVKPNSSTTYVIYLNEFRVVNGSIATLSFEGLDDASADWDIYMYNY